MSNTSTNSSLTNINNDLLTKIQLNLKADTQKEVETTTMFVVLNICK